MSVVRTVARQKLTDDDFKKLMIAWVEWDEKLEALGFSSSTPVWRAQFGTGGGEFQSSEPFGIKLLHAEGWLRELIDAMDALLEDDQCRFPIICLQNFWKYGKMEGANVVALAKTKFYGQVCIGEALVKREMKRG